jgi:anti-sigma regulatory factor (Ser/Thr protein kinase)
VTTAVHAHEAGSFEHRALVHDDAEGVVDEVARVIEGDLRDDHAVLVCLAEPTASGLQRLVEPHSRLHFLDVSDRYTRPIDALQVMWRFSRDQIDAGAVRVHSIGELQFTGVPADDDWHWYEAACSSVLDDLPLTATCLYDTRRCPESALAMVHATHDVIEHGDARLPLARTTPPTTPTPPSIPERRPDVEFASIAEGRLVRDVFGERVDIDVDVFERASLVFSELIANAVRHGGGAAKVELWFDGGAVVGLVTDRGPGIEDPFASMRPPNLDERGFGLWLSHLEATRLVVERRWPRGTKATVSITPD